MKQRASGSCAGRSQVTCLFVLGCGTSNRNASGCFNNDGLHPESFPDALRTSSSVPAGCKDLPGRLLLLRMKSFFYYDDEPVVFLRNVPRNMETAAARTVEDLLGEGLAVGGILALDQRIPVVRDSCTLQRLHDQGACCKCGRRGHLSASCPANLSEMPASDLPYIHLRTERRMEALQQRLKENLSASSSTVPVVFPRQPTAADEPQLAPQGRLDVQSSSSNALVREGLPSRRRLKFKQPAPDYYSRSPHNLFKVSGVSHVPQTNADYGKRRCFQVSVARADIDRTKLYFKYRVTTAAGTDPSRSDDCWQKASGSDLNCCGRDVCAYDAAVTCHAELIAALPDKRRRVAEGISDDASASSRGELNFWKEQWL